MKKKFKLDKQTIENIDSQFPDDTVGELDVYDDEADTLDQVRELLRIYGS